LPREPKAISADLRDFDDDVILGSTGPAAKLAQFLSRAVEAATARPPGLWENAPLRCFLRPGRGSCLGGIVVRRRDSAQDDFRSVEWLCVDCGDHGVITGWEGSPFDLRYAAADVRDLEMFEVVLSWEEMELLRSVGEIPVELGRLLAAASFMVGRVFLLGTADELKKLVTILREEAAERPRSHRSRNLMDIARCTEAIVEPQGQIDETDGGPATLH
jgi:hypothetical protein